MSPVDPRSGNCCRTDRLRRRGPGGRHIARPCGRARSIWWCASCACVLDGGTVRRLSIEILIAAWRSSESILVFDATREDYFFATIMIGAPRWCDPRPDDRSSRALRGAGPRRGTAGAQPARGLGQAPTRHQRHGEILGDSWYRISRRSRPDAPASTLRGAAAPASASACARPAGRRPLVAVGVDRRRLRRGHRGAGLRRQCAHLWWRHSDRQCRLLAALADPAVIVVRRGDVLLVLTGGATASLQATVTVTVAGQGRRHAGLRRPRKCDR